MNRSTSAPARRSQFFSAVATCSASSASSRCMCGFCRRGSFISAAPRRELLEEAAVARIGEARLHRLPGRVGKLDRARVMRRAEIPGEREQHEGVVVGVARIVERRAFGRDRAKPAAVRRARGADEKRKAVARRLAERRIAVEHIGVAEHVSEPRLHQRGAARAPDRAAQRVDLLGEAAGRIGDALQPERADVFEQPRPQACADCVDRTPTCLRRLVTPRPRTLAC